MSLGSWRNQKRPSSRHSCDLTVEARGPNVAPPLDKGTLGESRGRQATGPRLLRDAGHSSRQTPQTAVIPPRLAACRES